MAYYAAVISLKHTIHRLLNSPQIPIFPSSRRSKKFAYKRVISLQEVLDKLESSSKNHNKMVESLREQIRDATYKLEDVLDSYVSDLFLSRSESHGDHEDSSLVFSLDLDEVVKQEINSFINMVKEMEELSNALPEEEEEEDDDDGGDDASRIDFGGMESKMVGLSNLFSDVKYMLLDKHFDRVVSISGMAGIGKTILAKEIYQDPEIFSSFDCRLWVTIGQKFQLRKIALGILAQLGYDNGNIRMEGDKELGKYVYTSLEGKRYLIVLDDVWNKKDWCELRRYLPFGHQSQVLLTTRLRHVHNIFPNGTAVGTFVHSFIMPFLNEEESWCLLRQKVFGEEHCPFELEKAGKKIARNCDGLPLLIVTVAGLLSKAEKTLEYWNKVAEKKDMSIFIEANDKISNVLLRSYKYLPQQLKVLFLYMGVFPSKYEITTSKLFNLWTAEDLLESVLCAKKCLKNLVSSNLVMAQQQAHIGGIKTCSLHSSFWHACVKQSWKEKFLLVISSFADSSKEGVRSRRRLCVYNNVLFAIKEVYNSAESISSARSLICNGPYHQYPVPICFGLRLLKVLDVLSVRFYKFPVDVVKLIHLRYLAITYNGKVPASISELWNLEYFIVRRHLNIIFPGDWSYMPVDIWNLKNLRHLQVMGSCLPYLCDALLPQLLKLSDISAHSCTKEIFERIPNLQKLGIQIELVPDASEPLSCFDHISHLCGLESLKCFIVNPNPAKPQLVSPPASITTFPSSLKKLSLSGFGYPWEYMSIIAKLPNLQALKLRRYAFRGPEWMLYENDFKQLHFLLLEDIDLVHLRSAYYQLGFPNLFKLIIRHCYKLKEVPLKLGFQLTKVELLDSPLVANYIQENEQAGRTYFYGVQVHSSWEDE